MTCLVALGRLFMAGFWLVMAVLAVAIVLLLAFVPTPPRRRPRFLRARRAHVDRRIPGRLCRLEDLAPADREILAGFRRAG